MSILNIGTSALLTTQGALATTSHNISNVNTEGYNRQRVEQGTRVPDFNGGYYTGTGVQIDSVQRLFDQFLADQVRLFTSQQQQLETFTSFSKQLSDVLGSESLSLGTGMDSFFDSVQAVADDPTSIAARQVMLTEADTLASRFNTLDAQLTAANNQINLNIDSSVRDINSLAQGIANLNQAITEAAGSGAGVQPNDLLDQRDKLINDLSKLVSVSVVEQSNGVFNVFIGSGQPLVSGSSFNSLTTIEDPNDGTRLQIAFGANQVNISNQLSGGRLGGLLTARRDVLDVSRTEIDSLAASLADALNQQHRMGLTLDGNAGGNLFTVPDPLPADWPKGAAQLISVAVTNPRDLAVAYPVAAQTNVNNDGTGVVAIGEMDGSAPGFDAANVLTGDITLTFDATTNEYTLTYGAETATFAYNPATDAGRTIDLNSLGLTADLPMAIELNGVPQTGDTFTISNNFRNGSFIATGDNRNALALAELQVKKTLDPNNTGSPTQTFGDAYGSLVANVATRTRQAEAGQSAQQGLLEQTRQRYDAISGVNLDEEAANLIKYQQSYQAAAQIITVSNTIFDTLISSF